MKKLFTLFLALALFLVPVASSFAATFITAKKSGDFYYELLEDGTVAITSYAGKKDKVSVPDKIKGKKVTVIRNGAFFAAGKEKAPSQVKLPKTLIRIEKGAFQESKITSIEIPDSVEYIGEYAFSMCDNLKTVTIGRGVREIPGNPFVFSLALEEIRVAEDHSALEVIDGMLFSKEDHCLISCPYLRSAAEEAVTVPEGTEIIGELAFAWNEMMTGVSLPDSLREIRDNAFTLCGEVTEMYLPAGVETLGLQSIYNNGITNLTVAEDNPYFHLTDGVLYSTDNTKLVWVPWYLELGEYVIPDSVTEICQGAFSSDITLERVTIPESVTVIGRSAFSFCTSLRELTLPGNLASIGESAFEGCDGLEELAIPDTVREIGEKAFMGCSSLRSIRIPEGVPAILFGTFLNTENLEEAFLPESVISIGNKAFLGSGIIRIHFAEGLETIGENAFDSCRRMEDFTLPSSIRSIGDLAFQECESLTEVTLPEGLEEIGWEIFSGCVNLSVIRFPASLQDFNSNIAGTGNACVTIYVVKGSPAEKHYRKTKAKEIKVEYWEGN